MLKSKSYFAVILSIACVLLASCINVPGVESAGESIGQGIEGAGRGVGQGIEKGSKELPKAAAKLQPLKEIDPDVIALMGEQGTALNNRIKEINRTIANGVSTNLEVGATEELRWFVKSCVTGSDHRGSFSMTTF